MRFLIDTTVVPARIALQDPAIFTAFSAAVTGPRDRLPEAVTPIGRFDGEHLFIRPDAVRALAGEQADDPEWEASLAGMLSFAAGRGWLDDDGAIRAHIEPS